MNLLLSFSMLLYTFLSLLTGPSADNAGHMQKPAVILIPAAFSKAAVYDIVKEQLSDAGYEVTAVDLPSVGEQAAHVDRIPDIQVVQNVLAQRLLEGKNVILVGNSYGATVICDAVQAFEHQSSMQNSGPRGKILGLIFVRPRLNHTYPATTDSKLSIRTKTSSQFSGFIPYISEATRLVFWDNDLTTYPPQLTLFNLLPFSQATAHAAALQPSSFAALNGTAKYIPYTGKFRCLYVVGKRDNTVTPEMAHTYFEQEGVVWEVEMMEGDHTPQLSRPGEFVRIVRGFAGEGV
jgi:pimeloyl-ACP methyl ester carboxylesterase